VHKIMLLTFKKMLRNVCKDKRMDRCSCTPVSGTELHFCCSRLSFKRVYIFLHPRGKGQIIIEITRGEHNKGRGCLQSKLVRPDSAVIRAAQQYSCHHCQSPGRTMLCGHLCVLCGSDSFDHKKQPVVIHRSTGKELVVEATDSGLIPSYSL
jgi:hypothetical protein